MEVARLLYRLPQQVGFRRTVLQVPSGYQNTMFSGREAVGKDETPRAQPGTRRMVRQRRLRPM